MNNDEKCVRACVCACIYLLVGVFVCLQGLHDGELCIVLEPVGLLAEDLPQHPQSQCADDRLRELKGVKFKDVFVKFSLA